MDSVASTLSDRHPHPAPLGPLPGLPRGARGFPCRLPCSCCCMGSGVDRLPTQARCPMVLCGPCERDKGMQARKGEQVNPRRKEGVGTGGRRLSHLLAHSPEAGTSIRVPHGGAGAQALGPSSAAFPGAHAGSCMKWSSWDWSCARRKAGGTGDSSASRERASARAVCQHQGLAKPWATPPTAS